MNPLELVNVIYFIFLFCAFEEQHPHRSLSSILKALVKE